MRLTPDHVLEAEQGLNCIGDRELVLRNMAIPVIENMAVARDSFDVIDLSGNMITVLGEGFPPFPRLTSLYLGSNRITKIVPGISNSLPSLQVLILTSNRLNTLDDLNLMELSRFSKLEVLAIQDNAVTDLPGLRQKVLQHVPTLKVYNFTKVSLAERQTARKEQAKHLPPEQNKRKMDHAGGRRSKRRRAGAEESVKTFVVGKLGEDGSAQGGKGGPARPLSKEQSEAVKKLIEEAQSVEDVVRIQQAIRNGTAIEFLGSEKPSSSQTEAGAT